MSVELKVSDIVNRDIAVIPPHTPATDVERLIEGRRFAVVGQDGRWGYIDAAGPGAVGAVAGAMADYALAVKDDCFLDAPVAEALDLLVAGPVLITVGDKPLGIHTPGLLARHLFLLYRRQQALTATVLDTVGEAVAVIDSREQVLAWNSRAEEIFGIDTGHIVGRPIGEFFSNLVVTGMLQQPRTVKDKYHQPRADTHVLINASPVYLDGEVIGGVSAERDITELVNLNRELSRASQEVLSLKEEIGKMSAQADPFAAIRGHNAGILEAVSMARRIAPAGVPVLLRGESGTGKEIFARAIHAASRRPGQFVEINCGAIPANLFESELFGYQPGAFTGADKRGKPGLFETANGGTLFLDEVGELPKEMQVKLLRVLQEKSFYRLGGGKPIHVDVRIIAATHRNLEEMIVSRDFRDDLYYRLNVVTLQLPTLRDRREDIPELVHQGVQHFASVHGKQLNRVDPALMAALLDYGWPGNVRELYNILERLVLLADSDVLGVAHLPVSFLGRTAIKPDLSANLPAATDLVEREMILQAMQAAGHNKAAAAKKLGIPRSTLYYKLEQLGLTKN